MNVQIGMIKSQARTARRALTDNLPNPWLAAYDRDVPQLVEYIKQLTDTLLDIARHGDCYSKARAMSALYPSPTETPARSNDG